MPADFNGDESTSRRSSKTWQYDHARLQGRRRFLRFLIRTIGFGLLAKLDRVEGLEHIPPEGPAIIMINHIAMIDPVAVMHVMPRYITPMAKIEVYQYPFIGIFPRLWGVIPVRREEVDRQAIQAALTVLKAGEIILVAPEAHRAAQLQAGKEGAAYLSSRSGAPIIPVAIDGTPGFPALRYSRRWNGQGVSIKFGRPFRFRTQIRQATRENLRLMTDEAMYILARMLPEHRRGVYADLTLATEETIEYL